MATPLTAVSRLDFRYTVLGLVHKLSTYMAYNNVLGQHQMNDRDGITTVLWTVGAQRLWDILRANFDSGGVTGAPSVTLLDRIGTLWNVTDVANLTGIGTGGGGTQKANQATWVLRDTALKKIRFITLENDYTYVGHFPNGDTGGTTRVDNITKMLNGVDANANSPFRWLKSRGDRFLSASGTVAGLTFDLNDKLKRARGLE